MEYLERFLGAPDKTVLNPKTSDFSGMRGIIAVKGNGWQNASGHITLWDGKKCADNCHLMYDPSNGTFTPEIASIWLLK